MAAIAERDRVANQNIVVKPNIRIPNGHILVSSKWRNTDLVSFLRSSISTLFEDDLGVVDFHPCVTVGVIYVSEAELVSGGSGCRRKLARFRKANRVRGVVLAENTPLSRQFFPGLQSLCVLELGLVLLAIEDQKQAAEILKQMVHVENRPETNPFRRRKRTLPVDQSVLSTLQCVPKLGEIRARLLLEKFQSLKAVCEASINELAEVIGKVSAVHVKIFFNATTRENKF